MRFAVSPWLVVATGGACGAALRHLLGMSLAADPDVWSIAVVNVAGAFLLGVIAARPDGRHAILFWRTGVLGAFTTFSAMTVETVTLGPAAGAVHLVGVTAAGLAAAVVGVRVGARLDRRGKGAGR